jgi:hypothetical protein
VGGVGVGQRRRAVSCHFRRETVSVLVVVAQARGARRFGSQRLLAGGEEGARGTGAHGFVPAKVTGLGIYVPRYPLPGTMMALLFCFDISVSAVSGQHFGGVFVHAKTIPRNDEFAWDADTQNGSWECCG